MLEARVADFLRTRLEETPGVQRLVVGFSGGLDSSVLLHVLSRVAPALGLPVIAVHVHHGLSPNADAWADHALRFCAEHNVACHVARVHVPTQASLEAAARHARQQAFATVLKADDVLLLAQHRDDQAETLLFRLLRGSGVTGLGAMRATGSFRCESVHVPLWRPLLDCPREALANHAREQRLTWVEDESNHDESLDRNFLRQRILPLLHQRWPAVNATFAATAQRLQEADALLDELADTLAAKTVDEAGRLRIPVLQEMALEKNGMARQRLLLRHWLRQQSTLPPDDKLVEKLRTEVLMARDDANPVVIWGQSEIRRYRNHLYFLPALPAITLEWQQEWLPDTPLSLPDGRVLRAMLPLGFEPFPLMARYRRGGERFFYRGQHRELKKLLQEQGIPPWERERLPLLWQGEELLAVVGTGLQVERMEGVRFYLERVRG